jgi:hypothetical protein
VGWRPEGDLVRGDDSKLLLLNEDPTAKSRVRV